MCLTVENFSSDHGYRKLKAKSLYNRMIVRNRKEKRYTRSLYFICNFILRPLSIYTICHSYHCLQWPNTQNILAFYSTTHSTVHHKLKQIPEIPENFF